MSIGLIVDVETTGLNPEVDKIIEFAGITFEYDKAGGQAQILTSYGALQENVSPLAPEIVRLTGLTDDLLRGQKIDWSIVNGMVSQADVIVAHNMNFDRAFLLGQPDVDRAIKSKTWACSMRHIDWDAKGFRSMALNYLAADHGFVNPFAHRALFDCATTFRLVRDHMPELVEKCTQKEIKIDATFAPFAKKDLLKQRKYRWDGGRKVWSRIVLESQLESEREFLGKSIYEGEAKHSESAVL